MNQHLLYCPHTLTVLEQPSDSIMEALNQVIELGEVFTDDGAFVEAPIRHFLVNNLETKAYQIQHGIPQLIPGLAISLEGLNTVKSVD